MGRLDDGYQTLISFAAQPAVKFYEKEVTPPGLDGGGEVDTTTMLNLAWRTRHPKALVTMAESNVTVAYDVAFFNEALALLNVNTLITITFPDGSTVAFWGWVNSFVPGTNIEGEQPTAEVAVIPSNQDDTGAEIGPVYTAPPV